MAIIPGISRTTDCNVVIQSQYAWYYFTIILHIHKFLNICLSIYVTRLPLTAIVQLYYSSIIETLEVVKMARGKKNLTLDEQLQKITTEIENMEASLKKMKETKTELEEQIHQARLVELDNLISENGLSFDEVKNLLCSKE